MIAKPRLIQTYQLNFTTPLLRAFWVSSFSPSWSAACNVTDREAWNSR